MWCALLHRLRLAQHSQRTTPNGERGTGAEFYANEVMLAVGETAILLHPPLPLLGVILI